MLHTVLLHVNSFPVDCSDWVYAYAFRLDVKRDVSVAPGGVFL